MKGDKPSKKKSDAALFKELSWEDALEYRKTELPSSIDPVIGRRVLLPYTSKVGRFCTRLRCRACPYESDFIPYGSAMTSTFKTQVTLIGLFATLSFIMIPAITINAYGQTAVGGTPVFSIPGTTIGNLPLIAGGNLTDFFITIPIIGFTNTTVSVRNAAVIYAGLDFVGVVLFLATYYALRVGLIEEEEEVNKSALGAERYTLFLPQIPYDTTETDLRTWALTQTRTPEMPYGYDIAEIHIVEDNIELLRLYMERGTIFRKLARVERGITELKANVNARANHKYKDSEYKLLESLRTQYTRLKDRVREIAEITKSFQSKGVIAAFITFDHPDARAFVLAKYPNTYTHWLCQPMKRKLKGQRLVVKGPPDPDTILWQNLHITPTSQQLRQTFTSTIAGMLIVISFLFSVWISLTNSDTAEPLPDCKLYTPGFTNGTYTQPLLMTKALSDGILRCYCSSLNFGARATWPAVFEDAFVQKCPEFSCPSLLSISPAETVGLQFCSEWLQDRVSKLSLTAMASISVAIVNRLLAYAMRATTHIEGHHSTDDLNKSLVPRLFFAQLLNTAVLTIIINAAWENILGVDLAVPIPGQYDDFSGGWFSSVGASFHNTMITLSVSPHLEVLLYMAMTFCSVRYAGNQVNKHYALEAQKRLEAESKVNAVVVKMAASSRDMKQAAKKAKQFPPKSESMPKPVPVPTHWKLQADLNENFVGAQADYVARYVHMLITIIVCYSFSAGMPLMVVIATWSLVVSHTVDKAAFLYYHKKPAPTHNGVVRYVVELFPMAAVLHLGVGIWMLGSMTTIRDALLDAAGLSEYVQQLEQLGGSTLQTGMLGVLYKRISQAQSLPLLILFVLLQLALLLRFIFRDIVFELANLASCGWLERCCLRCCSSCEKEDDPAPTFTVASSPELLGQPGGINGVKNYNILENPELQLLLGITTEFASMNKGLASISRMNAEKAMRAAAFGAATVKAHVPLLSPGAGGGWGNHHTARTGTPPKGGDHAARTPTGSRGWFSPSASSASHAGSPSKQGAGRGWFGGRTRAGEDKGGKGPGGGSVANGDSSRDHTPMALEDGTPRVGAESDSSPGEAKGASSRSVSSHEQQRHAAGAGHGGRGGGGRGRESSKERARSGDKGGGRQGRERDRHARSGSAASGSSGGGGDSRQHTPDSRASSQLDDSHLFQDVHEHGQVGAGKGAGAGDESHTAWGMARTGSRQKNSAQGAGAQLPPPRLPAGSKRKEQYVMVPGHGIRDVQTMVPVQGEPITAKRVASAARMAGQPIIMMQPTKSFAVKTVQQGQTLAGAAAIAATAAAGAAVEGKYIAAAPNPKVTRVQSMAHKPSRLNLQVYDNL